MSATSKQNQSSDANRSDDSEPPSTATADAHATPALNKKQGTFGHSNTGNAANTDNTDNTAKSPKSATKASKPNLACKLRLRLRTEDCNPPITGWLKEHLARICVLAGVKKGEIILAIVDDKEMAQLHEQFTGVKGTTDVLTFDHRDDKRVAIESDLIICLDTAGREAKARGHETRLEVLLYAVHGLNHLLGGDDHTYKAAKAMHQWEDKMLTAAGFGAVFHRPEKTGSPRQTNSRKQTTSRGHGGKAVSKTSSNTRSKPSRKLQRGPVNKTNQARTKAAGQSRKKVQRQNGTAKGHAT